MREWHHWLVGNIHVVVKEGNFLPDIFESDMMSRYVPPNPQNGTGECGSIIIVLRYIRNVPLIGEVKRSTYFVREKVLADQFCV